MHGAAVAAARAQCAAHGVAAPRATAALERMKMPSMRSAERRSERAVSPAPIAKIMMVFHGASSSAHAVAADVRQLRRDAVASESLSGPHFSYVQLVEMAAGLAMAAAELPAALAPEPVGVG